MHSAKPARTKTARISAIGGLAVGFAALVAGSASALSDSLEGSWSGGGKVVFPSGSVESARCRVNYSRESKTTFSASASCATASGRVDQSATLRQTGSNSYSGRFQNAEYGISGSINVTVNGSSQSVSLNGGNGSSASLQLRR